MRSRLGWPLIASLLLLLVGALLVAYAFADGVGAESVALEVGAACLMFVGFFVLERNLEQQMASRAGQTDEKVSRIAERVDEAVEQIEARVTRLEEAPRGAIEVRNRRTDEMFDAFVRDPSVSTLGDMFERCRQVGRPTAVQTPITDICALNVSMTSTAPLTARLKLFQFKTTGPPTGTEQIVEWEEGDDYEDVVAAFIESWVRSQMYPGDAEAKQFDLAGTIAACYRKELAAAVEPNS